MFVLDTNVLSAIMRSQPAPEVAAWIVSQSGELLFTATVCQAEIMAGLATMPEGRRRLALVVFEILGPISGRTDRTDKLREYAAVPSILRYGRGKGSVAASLPQVTPICRSMQQSGAALHQRAMKRTTAWRNAVEFIQPSRWPISALS